MLRLKNVKEHPVSTLSGILVGLLQAGVTSAAIAYSQNPGQITDWKPYAAAGASGILTAIMGGLLPSNEKKIKQSDPIQEAIDKIMVESVLNKLK